MSEVHQQTPIGETFATLCKLALGYVLAAPDDTEAIEAAAAGFRRGIDRLNTRNWNRALTYDDISFVADQTEYELTSWFKAPHNFELWNTDSVSIARLAFKPWKTFLLEHTDASLSSDPAVYSVPNASDLGTVTLNCAPSVGWVEKYPSGRVWYFRNFQYPNGMGETLDVPSPFLAYLTAWAEGYVADRYAPDKAPAAYSRSREALRELVKDDNDTQTDWG